MSATNNTELEKDTAAPSPEDIVNEFQYVLEEAPDRASRDEARNIALARIRRLQEEARLEGFRKFERMHFDD